MVKKIKAKYYDEITLKQCQSIKRKQHSQQSLPSQDEQHPKISLPFGAFLDKRLKQWWIKESHRSLLSFLLTLLFSLCHEC